MALKRPLLRFVDLAGKVGIFEQLRIEEILMRHDQSNWCFVNRNISPPTVVLGISGKVDELVEAEACLRDSVPLIKRFSGGGTVIVDENTYFVSFIMSVGGYFQMINI